MKMCELAIAAMPSSRLKNPITASSTPAKTTMPSPRPSVRPPPVLLAGFIVADVMMTSYFGITQVLRPGCLTPAFTRGKHALKGKGPDKPGRLARMQGDQFCGWRGSRWCPAVEGEGDSDASPGSEHEGVPGLAK